MTNGYIWETSTPELTVKMESTTVWDGRDIHEKYSTKDRNFARTHN